LSTVSAKVPFYQYSNSPVVGIMSRERRPGLVAFQISTSSLKLESSRRYL
jgi:hypothetical protein